MSGNLYIVRVLNADQAAWKLVGTQLLQFFFVVMIWKNSFYRWFFISSIFMERKFTVRLPTHRSITRVHSLYLYTGFKRNTKNYECRNSPSMSCNDPSNFSPQTSIFLVFTGAAKKHASYCLPWVYIWDYISIANPWSAKDLQYAAIYGGIFSFFLFVCRLNSPSFFRDFARLVQRLLLQSNKFLCLSLAKHQILFQKSLNRRGKLIQFEIFNVYSKLFLFLIPRDYSN